MAPIAGDDNAYFREISHYALKPREMLEMTASGALGEWPRGIRMQYAVKI
jgi:hypothetical protein